MDNAGSVPHPTDSPFSGGPPDRVDAFLGRIAPTGVLIGACFAAAGVIRLVATPVEAGSWLFSVLAILDLLAMASAFALFAVSSLTATSRPARVLAWLLSALYVVLLIVSPIAAGSLDAARFMGLLAWATIIAGLVFGAFIMRTDALPVRIRQLPLSYYAVSIVVALSFTDEPIVGYITGAVLLLLLGGAFIGFMRGPRHAESATEPDAPPHIRPEPPATTTAETPAAPVAKLATKPAVEIQAKRPREGWYADPAGESSLRWWDGAAWTTRTEGQSDGR